MKQQYAEKLFTLQERAREDETYLSLLAEYRRLDPRLVRTMEEMPAAHRDVVLDCMGALHAIYARMLEIAFQSYEKC